MRGPACAVPVVECADEMCGACAMCTRCCNCPAPMPPEYLGQPECVRIASCEPGDHSYSWPCAYEWGTQETGTVSQDRKLTTIGGIRLALGIVAAFWIAVAVGLWQVLR